MIQNQYDLAVVGASFAGLACATAASARNVRTLVIDRKPEPGAAVRTTGLLVKEAADEWDVPRRLTRKIHGVRLYGPSLHWIDLHAPGYYFLATNTPALLRWFSTRAYLAGVQIENATKYAGARHAGGCIELDSPRTNCRYLVGADGARSAVARDFNLGRNQQFLIGTEIEFENVRGVDDDFLHVFLDSQLAPGYIAWVVPGVGITQVGLACKAPAPGLGKPRIDDFIRKISGRFDFSAAKIVGRRGGLIPCGGPVRPFATDRVMLVGDAAGMVSPLTAGGIHTAIHYGRCAGLAVSDYLLDAGPEPGTVMKSIVPRFMFKRLMRAAFNLGPPNVLIDLALQCRPCRATAQAIFYHHRGLFSPAAWRDLILAWR